MDTKNIVIVLAGLIVLGGIVYFFTKGSADNYTQPQEDIDTVIEPIDDTPIPVEPDEGIGDGAGPVPQEPMQVIGASAGGNDITAYHFGEGSREIMFIGGVHGGYSFNTALVAFELIDYLEANPDAIPENLSVTVIPVLNPDGLEEVTDSTDRFDPTTVTSNTAARVPGRFNANDVDLNRNFDCEWSANATWQNRDVSGGDEPFSEPEAATLRAYVEENDPTAIVVYFSQAGGVYSSNCRGGVLPDTVALTNAYADAAGYPAFEEFDYYEITGDMVNWFAKNSIPAISVLLTNHTSPEWAKNQKGVEAVLEYYGE